MQTFLTGTITAAALAFSVAAASAQVVEYDVPYESKWEPTAVPAASSTTLECRTLFGILPCHDGFDYNEPEGDDSSTYEDEDVRDEEECETPTRGGKGKGKGKTKGNASANNGRGGNYDRTGHNDNGRGNGQGRR